MALTEIFPLRFHNRIAKHLIDDRIVSSRWEVSGSDETRGETAQVAPSVERNQAHEIIRRSLIAAMVVETGGARSGNHNVAASKARALKRSSDAGPDIPPKAACTH
ncbi:hypothetical protein [Bradyrhizobium septentrionale]|uniref:Uncharacterized protein n=1 Tax=Bradyrhizobium septentrionale TaxID=1404411 RepID=A0A973VYY0_9BRAD|nr:hypothetical protein [Bradyrhizobium septentrionale]UGY13092.1 hypothetical protein HAP48_0031435 [Bradyrhizobium septentrionale]UGY21712.1 hypothetical protein HU675_0027260 [Bradyrhizobium septentrionale]